jgi:hypothetical protein
MWTSFHHQPEAQHPKSSAFHKLAGRLPHLLGRDRTQRGHRHEGRLWPNCDIGHLLLLQ